VWGDSPHDERRDALTNLASGRVKVVFSVDLFNEGIDVPQVDTLLMLRPTDSPVLFLQQLGRGLRRSSGKGLCTVLDFVGQHRSEFRFDRRLQALLGGRRREVEEQVKSGFPFLPAGCHMELDPVAAEIVLDNLRQATRFTSLASPRLLVQKSMHQKSPKSRGFGAKPVRGGLHEAARDVCFAPLVRGRECPGTRHRGGERHRHVASQSARGGGNPSYEEFTSAFNRHDTQAMAAMWTRQGDHYEPDGSFAEGRDAVEKLFAEEHAGAFKNATIDLSIDTVWMVTPNVALVNGFYRVSGVRDLEGNEIAIRKGHLTSLLVADEGQWWVAASRATIPVPVPWRKPPDSGSP
jgi:uncharacterized protein (TIGR02246 family)